MADEGYLPGLIAVVLHGREGLHFKLAIDIADFTPVGLDGPAKQRPCEFVLYLREQEAEGAEKAWVRRDDHLFDLQLICHLRRDNRAVAAEGEKSEIPGVPTPIRRYRLDRPHHRRPGHDEGPVSHLDKVLAQRFRHLPLHC